MVPEDGGGAPAGGLGDKQATLTFPSALLLAVSGSRLSPGGDGRREGERKKGWNEREEELEGGEDRLRSPPSRSQAAGSLQERPGRTRNRHVFPDADQLIQVYLRGRRTRYPQVRSYSQ